MPATRSMRRTKYQSRVDSAPLLGSPLPAHSQTSQVVPRADLQQRAAELASTEIAFVDHPEFRKRGAEKWLEGQRPQAPLPSAGPVRNTVSVAFVAGFVRAPLLTPDQERYLFLRMNYLKFRAEQSRRRLRIDRPNPTEIAAIEQRLEEANGLRNTIVESNLRLVVSVARKLSQSLDHLSELIGEGLLPLMRAVELFDIYRGNRFSTYATWAIRNQMIRMLRRQAGQLELRNHEEEPIEHLLIDHRPSATADCLAQEHQRQFLDSLVRVLGERERRIIAARFGLDGEPAGQSLSDISQQLGLSKERVRQIVLQSLTKLRDAAAEADFELPDHWSTTP